MLHWLRKKLREWLIDEEGDNDNCYLDCVFRNGKDTKVVQVIVVGVVGTCLRAHPLNHEGGERIVTEGESVDRKRFWKLWKQFKGANTYQWEDGTTFEGGDYAKR